MSTEIMRLCNCASALAAFSIAKSASYGKKTKLKLQAKQALSIYKEGYICHLIEDSAKFETLNTYIQEVLVVTGHITLAALYERATAFSEVGVKFRIDFLQVIATYGYFDYTKSEYYDLEDFKLVTL